MMPFMAKAQDNAAHNVVLDTTVCNNYTWPVNQTTYTSDTLEAVLRGDTLYILRLVVDHDKTYTVPEDVNGGCTYTWGTGADATVLSTPGQHSKHFQTVLGHCDSLVTINLVLNTVSSKTYDVTACASYTFHDSTYTESTTDIRNIQSAGCDSILTLNLTIMEPEQIAVDTLVTACNKVNFQFSRGFPKKFIIAEQDTVITTEYFVLHGQASDLANWSNFHPRTVEKCFDSIRTARITIHHSSYIPNNVTSCDSYTFTANDPDSSNYIENVYTFSTVDTIAVGKNVEGCDSSAVLHLTINKSPIVTIHGEYNLNPETGNTVLYATSDMSGVRYEWETTAQNSVSGSIHDTIAISGVNGNVDVTAVATKTSTGCKGYGRITILCNVGIENAETAKVNLYPNPTTDVLHIDCEETISNVAIFNALGQRMMVSNQQGNAIVMNLSALTKGTYTMRIELENGSVINRKFIVAK